MTTTRRVVVDQNNDELLQFSVTEADSIPSDLPYDITSYQVDFYIKSSPLTSDLDPSTVHLSTTTGEITLTEPVLGICQVFISKMYLQTPGDLWYRLDVTTTGNLRTAGDGPLYVRPH